MGKCNKVENFYKSNKWETFRQIMLQEKQDADGVLRCAICGEPVQNKYDAILHHKKELTEENVDCVGIALNPDNVEWLHYKCHNKEHNRYEKVTRKKEVILLVTAPNSPRAERWIKENIKINDVCVDYQRIKEAVTVTPDNFNNRNLVSFISEIRDKAYELVKYRWGKVNNYYIITTATTEAELKTLECKVQATSIQYIPDTLYGCLENKHEEDAMQVSEWVIKDYFRKLQIEKMKIDF